MDEPSGSTEPPSAAWSASCCRRAVVTLGEADCCEPSCVVAVPSRRSCRGVSCAEVIVVVAKDATSSRRYRWRHLSACATCWPTPGRWPGSWPGSRLRTRARAGGRRRPARPDAAFSINGPPSVRPTPPSSPSTTDHRPLPAVLRRTGSGGRSNPLGVRAAQPPGTDRRSRAVIVPSDMATRGSGACGAVTWIVSRTSVGAEPQGDRHEQAAALAVQAPRSARADATPMLAVGEDGRRCRWLGRSSGVGGSSTAAPARRSDVVVEDGASSMSARPDADEAIARRTPSARHVRLPTHVTVSPDRLDTNRELETPFSYWFYVASRESAGDPGVWHHDRARCWLCRLGSQASGRRRTDRRATPAHDDHPFAVRRSRGRLAAVRLRHLTAQLAHAVGHRQRPR